jgi:hypothetical protein
MSKPETIKIDDVTYVREDAVRTPAPNLKGIKYVIVRTYSAGVFAGWIESRTGQEVVMRNCRRLWYWDGACSLSQMAMEGVKKPENCKFSMLVDRQELLQAIEILDCTERAFKSIDEVVVWKK